MLSLVKGNEDEPDGEVSLHLPENQRRASAAMVFVQLPDRLQMHRRSGRLIPGPQETTSWRQGLQHGTGKCSAVSKPSRKAPFGVWLSMGVTALQAARHMSVGNCLKLSSG